MTNAILKGIPVTASAWQLYSSMEGADDAALQIAQTLSDLIRANYAADLAFDEAARVAARRTIRTDMDVVMSKHSNFGACDSEPMWVLSDLLDDAFALKHRD